MPETILVTGSTGFIGLRMLDYLAKQGNIIRVFLRPESVVGTLPEGVEVVRGSFSDLEALACAVRGVDRIVHLAGLTKAVDEAGYNAGNVTPVENLLDAISEHNKTLKRFLFVSSLTAAGPASEGLCGVRESDFPNPVSAYGRSKLRAETLCMERSTDIPITIVRPPAVYGPGDRDVLQVFQMLAKGVLVTAGSAAKQRFSMIYIDDLVSGIMMAARADKSVGRIYYITVIGFKKLLKVSLPKPLVYLVGLVIGSAGMLSGKPSLINRDKANELVQDYWVCSPEQAELDFGFNAGTSLDEGVAKTISWYYRQGWM